MNAAEFQFIELTSTAYGRPKILLNPYCIAMVQQLIGGTVRITMATQDKYDDHGSITLDVFEPYEEVRGLLSARGV